MRSNNNNEAITRLAMPERQIPVLIDSSPEMAEGYVPLRTGSGEPVTQVRRLLPTFVQTLKNPQRRKEIEREHGGIDNAECNRLRDLLDLKDRLNAEDWSPVITPSLNEMLGNLLAQSELRLKRMSPEGWIFDKDGSSTGKVRLISARPSGQPAAEPELWDEEWTVEATAIVTPPILWLSEAFTAGMSKARFVVWWSDAGKKLVPGLYCPDIVTALYALAMWSSGTAGGWAICQNPRCKKDYPRSRVKQRYCSHKCQVAAAMQRFRDKAKSTAQTETKPGRKTKKRTGRK